MKLAGIILGLGLWMVADIGYAQDAETLRKAETGDAASMFQMGLDYDLGQNAPVDKTKAAYWYEKSVEAGLPYAFGRLAQMYEAGEGVVADAQRAQSYYEKSEGHMFGTDAYPVAEQSLNRTRDAVSQGLQGNAEEDDAEAQLSLAIAYQKGTEGVERDPAKALHWASRAAEQGEPYAFVVVLRLLTGSSAINEGRSPEEIIADVKSWLVRADRVPETQYYGLDIYRGLTPERLLEFQTYDRLETASQTIECAGPYSDGCSSTGISEAMQVMKTLAQKDVAEAQYRWGIYARSPEIMAAVGQKADPSESLIWFEKAAAQEHVDAMVHLAGAHEFGDGTPADVTKAVYWYDRAQKAIIAERSASERIISGGYDLFIDCKLHFLRGDPVGLPYECEALRHRRPY